MLVGVLLLFQLKLIVFRNKLLVSGDDVLELRELIGVGVLHTLQEHLEFLHRLNF